MHKILINATNLHSGGGVQVAVSFLYEISKLKEFLHGIELHIYASSKVNSELRNLNITKDSFTSFSIIDVFGLSALKKTTLSKFENFDLVFTIFGPFYLTKKIPNHIIGFAQLWILHPKNEVSERLSFKDKILTRLKFNIQWLFFRWSATRLVVELDHVKNKLIKLKSFPANRIDVVKNCVSSIYFNDLNWKKISISQKSDEKLIRIGYISRAYPHKNIEFISYVAQSLEKISTLKFEFFVTLTESEWNSFPKSFRSIIKNIGPLTVDQCPSFYKHMDGVIFTSLLECFSATPLEAIAMKKPLFASDRNFVHDCCGEHAIYIDPMDSTHTATKIHEWFSLTSKAERDKHVENAYRHLLTLPTGRDRALNYVKIIKSQLQLYTS